MRWRLRHQEHRCRLHGFLLGALAVALMGCGGPAADWAGTIEDVGGVVTVSNPPEPLWPPDARSRLGLELEQVFGVDERPADAILSRISDVAVDADGNVFVLDSDDAQIVAFASDGTVRWRAGRAGEGPGELVQPRGLAWVGGERIYLLDKSGAELEWWSTSGDYLGERRLTGTLLSRAVQIGSVGDGTLALFNGGQVLLLGAGEPWPQRGYFEADSGAFTLPGGGIAGRIGARSGSVTAGNVVEYVVRIYGLDGGLSRVIERTNTGFVTAAADPEQATFAFMGIADPPFRLPDGRWLVQASWPTNIEDPEAWLAQAMAGNPVEREMRHVLDLYDDRGRWLETRVWDHPEAPEHGTILAVGPAGRLYTSLSDPFPQVRRYRIEIDAPGS